MPPHILPLTPRPTHASPPLPRPGTGTPLDGILLVFSTMEDLEQNSTTCPRPHRQEEARGRRLPPRRRKTLALAQVVLRHEPRRRRRPAEVGSVHARDRAERGQAAGDQVAVDVPRHPPVRRRQPRRRGADRQGLRPRAGGEAATLRSNGVRRVSVLSRVERDRGDGRRQHELPVDLQLQRRLGLRRGEDAAPHPAAHRQLARAHRLSNFHVERCWFPDTSLTHVYHATAVSQKLDTRLFVRTVVLRPPRSMSELAGSKPSRRSPRPSSPPVRHPRAGLPHHHSPLHSSLTTHPILEQAIDDSRYSKSSRTTSSSASSQGVRQHRQARVRRRRDGRSR